MGLSAGDRCVWVRGRKRGRVWVCVSAHAPVHVFTTHGCNSLKFIKKCFPSKHSINDPHAARRLSLWICDLKKDLIYNKCVDLLCYIKKKILIVKTSSSSHLWLFQKGLFVFTSADLPDIGLMLIYLDTSTFKRDWSGKILRGECKLFKPEVAGGRGRRLWPENLHKLCVRAWDRESCNQPFQLTNHLAIPSPSIGWLPFSAALIWTETMLFFFFFFVIHVLLCALQCKRLEEFFT